MTFRIPPIARFLIRRSVQAVILIFCLATLDFFLLHLAPGDAADAIAGSAGTGDAAYVENLRKQLGLDLPLLVQLGVYLLRLVQFDFGYSFRYGTSVASLIFERMPATLLLMGVTIGLAAAGGVILGVLSARYANRPIDRLIGVVTLFFYATPLFWIGLMMILLFSVKLGWLPTGGMYNIASGTTGLAFVGELARHVVLPALTQAFFLLAIYTRLVRASMLEVYGMDYVRLARAKGISETRVALRHVLRNALMPLITMVGMNLGTLLGGAVLTETVFSWPGIGRLMFDAVFQRDVNLLLSILVLSSVFVIVANIIVDLLYVWLNPAVELR